MRKKHRNIILQIIKDHKISPLKFEILEGISDDKFELSTTTFKYKDSPFFFEIRTSNDSYELFDYRFVLYGPKFPITDYYPEDSFEKFEIVANDFDDWIEKQIIEYEEDKFEPDLWADYITGSGNIDINQINFNDKTQFSTDEQRQVGLAINEVKYLVEKYFDPTERELILINERLNYLIDSSQNLNKFDWKSLLFSTIIGIATTLTLDTEKGKLLLELFRKVFSSVKLIP